MIRPKVVYWLFFKIEFLEIIKIDSKKMKIRRIDAYKISKENSSIFNISIIAIDKRKETINWGSFVNLKNLIIM